MKLTIKEDELRQMVSEVLDDFYLQKKPDVRKIIAEYEFPTCSKHPVFIGYSIELEE